MASNSSKHRIQKAKNMQTPTNIQEIVNVLGDQSDKEYPMFCDETSHRNGQIDSMWNVASVLFDLG